MNQFLTRYAFLLLPFTAFAQGDLSPPGAPARTMKTLDQLEPRTPISSVPFIIDAPGSYYLTRNLQFTAESGDAITVTVSDVTLDLMGFTLSSAPAVTGDAIRMNPGLRNIAVKNGTITGNTTVTTSGTPPNQAWTVSEAGFAYGINSSSTPKATGCQFSHLRIFGCRSIGLDAGNGAVVEQVTVSQNGGTAGIVASAGSVTNCSAHTNNNNGINASLGSVTNCTAYHNRGTGIDASAVANSRVFSNGGNGIFATQGSVTNCSATASELSGIVALNGSISNSVAYFNGSHGISCVGGVVAFCKAGANNQNNNGSLDIDGATATRTGNNPTP